MQARAVSTNFPFMRYAVAMGLLSVAACVLSIALIATKGLNLGLDFTGGTVIEVSASKNIDLDEVRDVLDNSGYGDAVAQHFGGSKEIMVRIPPLSQLEDAEQAEQVADDVGEDDDAVAGDKIGHDVFDVLSAEISDLELSRVEFVGPQVGDELRDQSGLAILVSLGMMIAYLWFRFTNKVGVAAVLALTHDVVIVLGVFALLAIPFDLTVLAAVLAVVGYSVNDTIVIADHIREDFRNSRAAGVRELIDRAINRTLSRTMITGLTTLLVLFVLYFFGGEVIKGFSLALIIGVVVGTYSSIYVANGMLLLMKVTREDFIPPEVNKEDVDGMP